MVKEQIWWTDSGIVENVCQEYSFVQIVFKETHQKIKSNHQHKLAI